MPEHRGPDRSHRMTAWEEFRVDVQNPDWFARAKCKGVDPEVFFPHRSDKAAAAQAVCARCPVLEECREYSIEHGVSDGVWGGMARKERRDIVRKRYDAPNSDGLMARTRARRNRMASMSFLDEWTVQMIADYFDVTERTTARDLRWLREKGKL